MKTAFCGLSRSASSAGHSVSTNLEDVAPPLSYALNSSPGNTQLNFQANYVDYPDGKIEEHQHPVGFLSHSGLGYMGPSPGYSYPRHNSQASYGYETQNFLGYHGGYRHISTNPHMSQDFETHESFSPTCVTGNQTAITHPHQVYAFHRPILSHPHIESRGESPANRTRLFPPRNSRDSLRTSQHPFQSPPNNSGHAYSFQIEDENYYRQVIRDPSKHQHSDFPSDPEIQRAIVQRIFNAIKSVEDAEDGEKAKASFKDQKIPDEAIEIACWNIMLRVRDSQEHGQLVPEFHKTKYEHWESFSARMEEIINILKQSKAVCKQLLQPNYIDRVADQPNAEHTRKGCNQRLNKKKATQNKLGKMVMDAGLDSQVKDIVHQQKVSAEEDEGLGLMPTPETVGRKRRLLGADAEASHRREKLLKPRTQRTSRRSINRLRDSEVEQQESNSGYSIRTQSEPWTPNFSPETECDNNSQWSGVQSQSGEISEKEYTTRDYHIQVPSIVHQSDMTLRNKSALEVEYMVEILKLLGLPIENYTWYNLDDLRFYALVYSSVNQNEKWYHPDLPKGYYGQSVAIYHNQQELRYNHFAEYLERVRDIAIDRGDTDKDGVYDTESPKRLITLEQVDGDHRSFQEKALGITPNEFGIYQFHQPFSY